MDLSAGESSYRLTHFYTFIMGIVLYSSTLYYIHMYLLTFIHVQCILVIFSASLIMYGVQMIYDFLDIDIMPFIFFYQLYWGIHRE